jgi:hypothetical protein
MDVKTKTNYINSTNINQHKLIKELVYQKIEAKLDLFEKCLNETGLYRSFPILDITYRLKFLKKILPQNIQNYPIDKTEENLMRNCIKRHLTNLKKIKTHFEEI